MNIRTELRETLFPETFCCAACGRELFSGEPFCPDCYGRLTRNDGHFCKRCGMPLPGEGDYCSRCVDRSVAFTCARSAFVYDEGLKPTLRRFKEKGEAWLARPLAVELERYRREFALEADVLTFVPLTRAKERRRGYNQSRLLAEALSERSGIPCEAMLERVEDRPAQKDLSFPERQVNLRGCFRLLPARGYETRRVLLVDDVMTTGATVNECCRILSKVCENDVKVFTICTAARKTRME